MNHKLASQFRIVMPVTTGIQWADNNSGFRVAGGTAAFARNDGNYAAN